MPTHKRLLLSVLALSGVSLLFVPDVQAHPKHRHHHGHHKHSHKKAKAYNKGYRHGLKTAAYGAPYGYGYGYRPHSRPVVVTPAPWGAPPVHVGQPNVGFGFYF